MTDKKSIPARPQSFIKLPPSPKQEVAGHQSPHTAQLNRAVNAMDDLTKQVATGGTIGNQISISFF